MTSTLSNYAIHRIIFLLENDDRPTRKKKMIPHFLQSRDSRLELTGYRNVNSKWKAIHELYMRITPAPPLGYLESLELALVLKGDVDDNDVRGIFVHGKPLEFYGCPRLLASKIVEAFTELHKEPEYLDVTVTALPGIAATRPSQAWPQVYTTHMPCHACTSVETVEERSIPQPKYKHSKGPTEAMDFVVEKFHVSSKCFRMRLTLELHYQFTRGMTATEREQSSFIHKLTIRLDDKTCSAQGRISVTANRSSATLLLLPEFASEVFGFLDRVHVGPSLVANRDLRNLICLLKQRLPVHSLKCSFETEFLSRAIGAYWMTIRHVQRDLSYTDVRRFKMPSTAGAENDCALIRHYLSNSHVADLLAPDNDFPFAIKMLADLARRNFSVGRVGLSTEAERLSDYRSMNALFGGMRMSSLHLSCYEHRFVELVKITNFFRMSTVQRLRELKLALSEPWNEEEKPRSHARSKSPVWVSGIYLLHNCELYRVDYRTDRHMKSIGRKVVRICEEFERGQIADTVEHFQFNTANEMNYAFSRDNLLVSGMKVERKSSWYSIEIFEWDVYRFRNASTGGYLTACVGRNARLFGPRSILHIVKGEVYPDASFIY